TAFFAWLGGKKMRLAMTAVGEHFTAVLSNFHLNHPDLLASAPDPLKQIWQWHSIEEIEHKGVVYDLLEYANGGYLLKLWSFIIMTSFLSCAYLRAYWNMMKEDNLHRNGRRIIATLRFFWGKEGIF